MEKRPTCSRIPHAAGRIRDAAFRLFYARGYGNTGLDRILAESGTVKSVFYHHFDRKSTLRDLYARDRIESMRARFLRLRSATSLDRFVHRWALLALAEARAMGYRGCALANLRAESEDLQIAPIFAEYLGQLEKLLGEAIAGYEPGFAADTSRHLSARLLGAYYGALQLYRFSGKPHYLRSLGGTFFALIAAARQEQAAKAYPTKQGGAK